MGFLCEPFSRVRCVCPLVCFLNEFGSGRSLIDLSLVVAAPARAGRGRLSLALAQLAAAAARDAHLAAEDACKPVRHRRKPLAGRRLGLPARR